MAIFRYVLVEERGWGPHDPMAPFTEDLPFISFFLVFCPVSAGQSVRFQLEGLDEFVRDRQRDGKQCHNLTISLENALPEPLSAHSQ